MITSKYNFNDPREREVIQIITKGTVDMIPPCPTILDLALFRPKNTVERRSIYRPGYRNTRTGDGVCLKCEQPKKNEEFATPKGQVCIECKEPGKRGATKNK